MARISNIPVTSTSSVIARNIVKKMGSSNSLLPVIALEAFVEAGRTYQAYKRGGFDEARERITEEFMGAVFWLSGVKAFNAIFEKVGQKILHLPDTAAVIASDDVRKPLDNFLHFKKNKLGQPISLEAMSKFKFAKVATSVILANAIIGFVLPKTNQAITRYLHGDKYKKSKEAKAQNNDNVMQNSTNGVINADNKQTQRKVMSLDSFISNNNDRDKNNNAAKVSFGMNFLRWADILENNRNAQLISVDAGNASGRAISARNNDERIEILFRDLSSVFFYMFSMPLFNKIFNKLEMGHSSRLDPVAADHATMYMQQLFKEQNLEKIDVNDFEKEFLGTNTKVPENITSKLSGNKIKTMSLETFLEELKTTHSGEELNELTELAQKMSKLQPEIKGKAILTEGQIRDIFKGGLINNPDYLMEAYKTKFGTAFLDKFGFVAQGDIDAYKKEIEEYVEGIIKKARKNNVSSITTDMLHKASKTNLKMNALNWGVAFAISAAFLSTFIPKLQYMITKWRTGSTDFPGTAEYREAEANKKA